jgi:hypothetical protein
VHCDSGADTPFTIAGASISCGRGRWLYEDEGPGSPNEWLACLPSPDHASSTVERPTASAPPPGLTPYGHDTWELDALLHDTFGERAVDLRWGNPYHSTLNNFTTNRVPPRAGGRFVYTFANASRSTFRLVRTSRPPQFFHGNTESWEPFTVRGAYVSCPHQLWLYEPEGEPNENQFVTCAASPPPPPRSPTTTGPSTLRQASGKKSVRGQQADI